MNNKFVVLPSSHLVRTTEYWSVKQVWPWGGVVSTEEFRTHVQDTVKETTAVQS